MADCHSSELSRNRDGLDREIGDYNAGDRLPVASQPL